MDHFANVKKVAGVTSNRFHWKCIFRFSSVIFNVFGIILLGCSSEAPQVHRIYTPHRRNVQQRLIAGCLFVRLSCKCGLSVERQPVIWNILTTPSPDQMGTSMESINS